MKKITRMPFFFSMPYIGLVALFVFLMAPSSLAETGPTAGHDEKRNPPAGSYKDSCIQLEAWYTIWSGGQKPWDQLWMRGKCRTKSDAWNNTSLWDYDYCEDGSINNNNGILTCTRKRTNTPPGSWSKSCINAYVRASNNTLVAICRKKNGLWTAASLALKSDCPSVANDDGSLKCESKFSMPIGSWSLSCYEAKIVGESLQARCRDTSGVLQWATLHLPCAKGAANFNGHLVCGGWADLLGGSWLQSCRNMNWDGLSIFAECRTKSGGWRNNTIVPAQCRPRQAWNNDGYLTCNK